MRILKHYFANTLRAPKARRVALRLFNHYFEAARTPAGTGDVNVERPPHEPPEKINDTALLRPRTCEVFNSLAIGRGPYESCRLENCRVDLVLPNGMLAQIDPVDEDLAGLPWHAWFKKHSWSGGWVVCRHHTFSYNRRKRLYLHRTIAFRMNFNAPEFMQVSPRDGNWLNCRRDNLRVYEKGRPTDATEPNPNERLVRYAGYPYR